jgi:hypothetical protein
MTTPLLLNPLFQIGAAFVLFFTAFITLFSFGVLCAAVGWALYRCTNRLAVLMAQSQQATSPLNPEADIFGAETESRSDAELSSRKNSRQNSDVARLRRPSPRSRPVAS